MKVVMVGTGYVGLVSGTCFADFGHDVICVDKDPKKIEILNAGEIPIFEPGLQALVASNVKAKRLSFTTDLTDAMQGADAVFIAVGTPSRRGDGHADLTYVYAAAKEIATHIQGFTVVATKSTVPVGTGDEIHKILSETCDPDHFAVVSNPEFLREGAAINDFKRPDRVVVGLEDPRARAVIEDLYRPLYINKTPIVFTSRRTSELIKYAANAFLATKITFINEMADLCEAVGANVQEVARGIGLDNRIGSKFLHAGPGYGGSCFPKDTLALTKTAENYDTELSIINAVVSANTRRKTFMAEKIVKACGGDMKGLKIAILGLAFKPNTDDMRDSPSLTIIPYLQEHGASVSAYDPEAMENAETLLNDVSYAEGPYECVDGADAVVILTEWDQFRALDMRRIKTLVKTPRLIDLRNVYDDAYMNGQGFEYTSIGR
mgnify:CR=1 FL=1